MIIVGAGLSGIIAGHYFQKLKPVILEKQSAIPNNHAALLRFRTDKVAKVTGIPFRSGMVRKCILSNGQFAYESNPFLANTYSIKVLGKVVDRSIWDLKDAVRYIAPENFISQAAWSLNISLGHDKSGFLNPSNEPIISTIPMPALMNLMNWPDKPQFSYLPVWSIQSKIISPSVDVFQTIYYPDLSDKYYRASITGDRLILEYYQEPNKEEINNHLDSVCSDFGILPYKFIPGLPLIKKHIHGKIAPIDDGVRKEFMYTMTREHNIYSLGRFATWKQILLDDVVDDCAVIESLIQAEGKRRLYHQSLSTKGKIHQ